MYKSSAIIALLGVNTFITAAHPLIDMRDNTSALKDVSQQTIFCTRAVTAWPTKDKPNQNSQNGCTYTAVSHLGMCTVYKPVIGKRMRAIKPAADQYCVAYMNSNCDARGVLIGPAGNMDLGDNINSYKCNALYDFLTSGDYENNDSSVFTGTNGAIFVNVTKRQEMHNPAPVLQIDDSVEPEDMSLYKRQGNCPTVSWCAYHWIPGYPDQCGAMCLQNRKCVNVPTGRLNDRIHSWSQTAPYLCYLYQDTNCKGNMILMDAAGDKVARADLKKLDFDTKLSSFYCMKASGCPPGVHNIGAGCA